MYYNNLQYELLLIGKITNRALQLYILRSQTREGLQKIYNGWNLQKIAHGMEFYFPPPYGSCDLHKGGVPEGVKVSTTVSLN